MWPFTKKKKVVETNQVVEQETQEEIVVESTVEEKDETTGSTRKPVYRVIYDKKERKWNIRKDQAKRVIESYVTKEEALARVEQLAASKDMKFIVHKKDGKFQKKR
jgi:uncharacterized protein YdaT